MKITFFGASVTKQKNGYVDKFINFTSIYKLEIDIKKYGYGSMHLYDAGICFINDILIDLPNYLFIDWFGTGFITNDYNYLSKYIDTIINKCVEIQCIPIFLILDRTDIDKRIEFNNLIKQYALQYNIYLIEITNCIDRDKYLRDSVHTTEIGAEYYANIIYNHFINIYDKPFDFTKLLTIPKTIYSNIKKIDYDKTIFNYLLIEGNCEIIGLYQTIGPYSGICELCNYSGFIEKFNLWDQWCYFQRDNIKLSIKIINGIKINVSKEKFDTSLAKEQNNDDNKKIVLKSIYYIGNISKIESE